MKVFEELLENRKSEARELIAELINLAYLYISASPKYLMENFISINKKGLNTNEYPRLKDIAIDVKKIEIEYDLGKRSISIRLIFEGRVKKVWLLKKVADEKKDMKVNIIDTIDKEEGFEFKIDF